MRDEVKGEESSKEVYPHQEGDLLMVAKDQLTMKDKRDEEEKLEKQKKEKDSKALSSKAKGKEKEEKDSSKKIAKKENHFATKGLGSSSSMDSFASLKMNGSGMEKEEREETPLQGEDESRRNSPP
ncbi:hypothetical protein HKD37_05G012765 [Glycine soja]